MWLNGHLVSSFKAKISVFDHSFLYGDGVYETIRWENGKIQYWPDHFKRLKASARAIQLKCPWSSAYLQHVVRRVVLANHEKEATLRVTISRGEGPLGIDPTFCTRPTLVIQPHPKRDLESLRRSGVRIAVVSTRHLPASTLCPSIKSNNMLPYIAAKLEAKRLGVFEGILLSQEGYLAEGTISNLFWVKKNIVYTPALAVGILPGVMRKHVIRELQKAGRKVVEGFFKPVVLKSADEVFITNSGIGKVRAKLK